MSSSTVTHARTEQGMGWILVFAVAILQTLTAVALLASSDQARFEADTGVSLAELAEAFPTVPDQIAMAQQSSLFGTLALGLMAMAVTYFALRVGQRWAWYVMWILPAFMLPGIVSLALTENQWGVAVFGGVIALVAVVGLILSYRDVSS